MPVVRLPYRELHGLEDAQHNFEWLEIHGVFVPAAPATVTGSRGGNAALASLLSALAAMGLIVDGTTP